MSNAEIVWFVVSYEPTACGLANGPGESRFHKTGIVDQSAKTGGVPLPKEKFEAQLLNKLKLIQPASPLVIRLIGLIPPSQSRFLPIRSSVIFAW